MFNEIKLGTQNIISRARCVLAFEYNMFAAGRWTATVVCR